jgi:hypothetical protein
LSKQDEEKIDPWLNSEILLVGENSAIVQFDVCLSRTESSMAQFSIISTCHRRIGQFRSLHSLFATNVMHFSKKNCPICT